MKFNVFKWADVFVLDCEAAMKFYAGMFGWKYVEQYENDEVVYRLACLGRTAQSPESTAVAGMAQWMQPTTQGKPCSWGVYIRVHSVASTAEKVVAANGKLVMPPMDVMQAGKMAICTDACGVVFHLWEPNQFSGNQIENVSATVGWYELTTANSQTAVDFYCSVFDWTAEEISLRCGSYWLFKSGDIPAGSIHSRLEETGGQEVWTPYFSVESLQSSLDKCRELGGFLVFGPRQEPGIGQFAVVSDTERNMFGIAQYEN